jgi:ketosteroid isomerase-like protein
MSEQENIKAAHAFYEAWNAGDLSKSDGYQADDFMAEGPGAPSQMNSEQYRMYGFLAASARSSAMHTIARDDYVVVNWRASVMHTGPLPTPSGGSIPPTGKSVTITGSSTSQFKNGKITRSWNFWDMTSMLTQLGLLPPM